MQEKKRKLTEDQEELRLSGLRILARLIARRCLADQRPGVDEEAELGRHGATSDEDVDMRALDEAA